MRFYENLRGMLRADPAAFNADLDALGYVQEAGTEPTLTPEAEDEMWLHSRERWGDDAGQPRRYPSLPLDHPLNDPRI